MINRLHFRGVPEDVLLIDFLLDILRNFIKTYNLFLYTAVTQSLVVHND